MANILKLENDIKSIIDELKGICQTAGLTGSAAEEIVISSTFLYKFLNDKFMWNLENFADEISLDKDAILANERDSLDAFYDTFGYDVAFEKEDTITFLATKYNEPNFYEAFDDVLEHISNNPKNISFSVETAEGERKALFTRITENVEIARRNNFAKNIFSTIAKSKFDFGEAFEDNFDFYSTIFEYLIKDYNTQSSAYADYFTPQAISRTISKILVNMSPIKDTIYDIYDPSAGSGSLILHLANELGHGSFGNKARVYTQDITQKSTRFLRLNMMLNGLTESLDNIIEGDTLLSPAHYEKKGDPNSGIKHFDYITANPPFKMDFSSTRNMIENKWSSSDRFFAGVPSVPDTKKDSMAIYLLFIQHILYSLKPNGKAAIVVPTGFITAKKGIEFILRKHIVDNKWLKGAIIMPADIFANTGTHVGVLFIDKENPSDEVMLIDASNLGRKIKSGKNKRTVLSNEEISLIEDTFIKRNEIKGFSVLATNNMISNKKYVYSAADYFKVETKQLKLTEAEYKELKSKITNEEEENLILSQKSKETIAKLLNNFSFSENNLKYSDIANRKIPEGWKCVKLGELFKFSKGKIPPTLNKNCGPNDSQYLTIEVLNGENPAYCQKDGMPMANGEVLMVMDGAASSEIYIGFNGIVGSTLCRLDTTTSFVGNNLLYLVLSQYIDVFKTVNTGSTVPHANKDYISDFVVCLPSDKKDLKLLNDYADYLVAKKIQLFEQMQIVKSLEKNMSCILMGGQFKTTNEEDAN